MRPDFTWYKPDGSVVPASELSATWPFPQCLRYGKVTRTENVEECEFFVNVGVQNITLVQQKNEGLSEGFVGVKMWTRQICYVMLEIGWTGKKSDTEG